MKLAALMMSCRAREVVRAATLASFARTDWQGEVELVIDDETESHRIRAITATWRRLLERALASDADFFLAMEDDLAFNVRLEHNLRRWAPLHGFTGDRPFFGSLYNPQRTYILRDDVRSFMIVEPNDFWGSQALILSRVIAGYLLRFWDHQVAADLLMPRLAARVGPIYQHIPSLVQHTGEVSTWGGLTHAAADYDPEFRAAGPLPAETSPTAVAW